MNDHDMMLSASAGGPTRPPAPKRPPPPGSTGSAAGNEGGGGNLGAGCVWLIVGAFGVLGIALLIPLVLVIFGITTFSNFTSNIGSAFGIGNTGPAVATITTTETIVQGIQPLGQLVSVSTQLAKADIYVGIGQGVLNACGFGANHVAQGSIEAGFDLTQIGEDDLIYDAERDRYTLTLPAPQLTSCRIDYIRQYNPTTTTCSVDWDEARLLANYLALEQFRDDAVEGGLLDRAEQEARLVMGNFVGVLTGKAIDIQFAQSGEAVIPPSCLAEVPAGWRFNPQNNNWER